MFVLMLFFGALKVCVLIINVQPLRDFDGKAINIEINLQKRVSK
ncbi:hypothetical protein BIW11_02756 [Tropilaelaps mercedesae]|uniref:Uncharacterized protein n=1 Tax=Tropilaelaps mercedesae TaxID=418985 RepID=A0A1V9XXZ4_9ACAR|nr:hypothetical protein BIW11_02756 [Tropilaelaps mercedesae]